MAASPHVATVILTYEDVKLTRECLRSVSQNAYPESEHRIYLVDNGSRRVPVDSLISEFPRITYIRNGHNLGFAAGMNTGICEALKDNPVYVFVLNNDTQVDAKYLVASVERLEADPTIGACGSMMLDYHDRTKIQEVGFILDIRRELPIPLGRGELDEGQHDCVTKVDSVCGGAMCLRASTLKRVGLFDPSFFCYWEDTDLCVRIRQSGHQVVCDGRSKIYHLGNFTACLASRLWLYCGTRNYLWFAKRHGFGAAALRLKIKRMPRTLGWLLLKARRGRSAGAYFRGLLHGWRQSPLSDEKLVADSFSHSYTPGCPYA
jgi:GT2 family glycosyltransferase